MKFLLTLLSFGGLYVALVAISNSSSHLMYAGDISPELVCVNDTRAKLILCSTNNDESIKWFVDWEEV